MLFLPLHIFSNFFFNQHAMNRNSKFKAKKFYTACQPQKYCIDIKYDGFMIVSVLYAQGECYGIYISI